jgi:hypothetical protein
MPGRQRPRRPMAGCPVKDRARQALLFRNCLTRPGSLRAEDEGSKISLAQITLSVPIPALDGHNGFAACLPAKSSGLLLSLNGRVELMSADIRLCTTWLAVDVGGDFR